MSKTNSMMNDYHLNNFKLLKEGCTVIRTPVSHLAALLQHTCELVWTNVADVLVMLGEGLPKARYLHALDAHTNEHVPAVISFNPTTSQVKRICRASVGHLHINYHTGDVLVAVEKRLLTFKTHAQMVDGRTRAILEKFERQQTEEAKLEEREADRKLARKIQGFFS